MRTADIERHEAREVLYLFGGPGGWRPGSFHTALLHAMQQADPLNRAKLAIAFPGYMAAVALVMDEDDGLERLHAIARQAPATTPGGRPNIS